MISLQNRRLERARFAELSSKYGSADPLIRFAVLKKAVPEDSETTDLLTIDTDAQQELAAAFKIAALPTVLAVRAGKPVSKFVGGLSPPQIKEFLDKCNE